MAFSWLIGGIERIQKSLSGHWPAKESPNTEVDDSEEI